MSTVSVIVQTDSKSVKQLDLLANSLHLSRNTLINYAIEQFLDSNDLQVYRAERSMRVQEGLQYAGIAD